MTRWSEELANIKRRRVAHTSFTNGPSISTVFLGIDHGTEGNPLLFETLVEGQGAIPDETTRWATWPDAIEGHRLAVREAIGHGCPVKRNQEWEKPGIQRRSQWERLTEDDDL